MFCPNFDPSLSKNTKIHIITILHWITLNYIYIYWLTIINSCMSLNSRFIRHRIFAQFFVKIWNMNKFRAKTAWEVHSVYRYYTLFISYSKIAEMPNVRLLVLIELIKKRVINKIIVKNNRQRWENRWALQKFSRRLMMQMKLRGLY